jgi:hypothetical protein
MSTLWTLERIYARCEVDEDGCRIWQGAMTKEGRYPITQVQDASKPHGQRQVHVRRMVWELAKGKPARSGPRYVLVAECGKNRCVDEGCLQLLSKSTRLKQTAATGIFANVMHRAKVAQGRRRQSKLSDEQVSLLRARAAAGEPVDELAIEYGLSRGYAYAVIRGKNRGDFTSPFAALIPPTPHWSST